MSPSSLVSPAFMHSGVLARAAFVDACAVLAKSHFGLESLRPAQVDVLGKIAQARGVLATLPTGAGKTLLYALPAMALSGGPVVVVCPLISLMRDQVRRMAAAHLPAVLFTSDQSEEERRASYTALFGGTARLVFVSPERFVMPSFQRALVKVAPSMVVVDEAHCVVSWGHAFRPEYKMLADVLTTLAPPRILAITATASRHSRKLIRENVFPPDINVDEVAHLPLAPNIFVEALRVYSENEKWELLVDTLRHTPYAKAIVYLPKRSLCEDVARDLRKLKIHAVAYHAALRKQDRQSVEDYLHKTTSPTVVCATLAFGMGVDLPDVDLVVVHGFPANVEEYFQMIGRAGRRGKAARSLLLWSGSDPKRRTFQFEDSFPAIDLLKEELACIDFLFPKEGSLRAVPEAALAKALTNRGVKADRKLAGLVAALRYLGVLESAPPREPCVAVTLVSGRSLEQCLLELPVGVTRRSQCLEALCRASPAAFRRTKGGETVVPLKFLCDDLQWPVGRVEEVLAHFAAENALSWSILSAEELVGQVLLSGNMALLRKRLPSWVHVRAQYAESLAQLERLAQSTHCRMERAEEFFAATRSFGATAGAAGSASGAFQPGRKRCMRCDLCFASVSRRSSKSSFELFREAHAAMNPSSFRSERLPPSSESDEIKGNF
ncbi:MAG: ATP-dependent DNA helicase RecQ [Silvanigrellales bacterium]|nr:ATP-dependent DNA helicase RecQ [Silvanigrellales bacterium]